MPVLKTLHADDTLRIVMEKNVLAAVWSDAPSVAQLRRLHSALNVLRREAPEGGILINLITGGTPRFSNEVREEAARITRDAQPSDLGTAHIILVGGLVGTAVRAFISTMTLVGRPVAPTKTFGDIASASSWLAGLVAGKPGPAWTAVALGDLAERAVAAAKAS